MTSLPVGPSSPRFIIQPSYLLPGFYAIHDTTTGLLARIRQRAIYRTESEAAKVVELLNRQWDREQRKAARLAKRAQ